MATNNSINLPVTNNADGYAISGGTTVRTLTLTGGDATITGSGSAVVSFPTSTSTLSTLALSEELTNKTLNASVGKGTWTASGTWALPAFTAGGLITSSAGATFNMTSTGIVATTTGSGTTVAATFTEDQSAGSASAVVVKNNTNFAWTGTTGILQVKLANGSDTGVVLNLLNAGSGDYIRGDSNFRLAKSGKTTIYATVTTAGWGQPAIYGSGRAEAQTARSSALATYTVGAADGSFEVSGNVNVTASATHSFSLDVVYTDETNASRTLVLPMAQLAGSFVTTGLITNVTGTGPYESPIMHIRCKAATSITIRPNAGTYTSVTYNAEGLIKQTA